MKPSRLMMAFVTMSCILASSQTLALEKPAFTDRAGRPVTDSQGHLNYATPASITESANITVQAVRTAITTPSTDSTHTAQLTGQWVAKFFGIGIGAAGMMHIDIDNDGTEEIVFTSNITANQGFWGPDGLSVLSYGKNSKSWGISRQYTLPQNSLITTIYTFRDANNSAMLAFGLIDNDTGKVTLKIKNLNKNTLVKEITINTLGITINEILTGDADNDGGNELIIVTDNTTLLFNIADYSASGNLAYGAAHAALGNVDNDADNELVYNGGKVVSYKNAKATLEWSYPIGFGNFVRLTNIDGDAPNEIIGADSWQYIRALDADIKSVKWEQVTDIDIAALRIADINADGKDDIVYGDGQWGKLHALDGNGTEFWSINNPEHGVTDIAILDADADGDQDIVWGAGFSSTGPDYLYLHDVTSKKKLFQSKAIDPPFRTVAFGDADNDGKKDFITITRTSESGYSDGIIRVIDADTGWQKWQSKNGFFGDFTWVGALAAAVGDVDNDGQNELVVVGDNLYDGAIYLVDVKNHKLKKTIILDSGSPLYAVKIADIDGDGVKDIIAGGGKAHTGSPGIYAYVVNGATGAIKWHSHNLSTGWNGVFGLDVADIDGNGNLDILVSLDYLFAFDGVTHVNWLSAANNYSGISTKSIPSGLGRTVVAGNGSGELQMLTGNLTTVKATYPVCSSAIGAVEMLDNSKILFTCGKNLKLFDLSTKTVIWTSGAIAGGLETDALAVTTVNGALKVGLGATFSRLMRYIPASQ